MLKQHKLNMCVNICPANNQCLQCLESLKTSLKALGLATNIWKTGFSPKLLPGDVRRLWETTWYMLVIGIPNVSAWTCCCLIKSYKISDQRIRPPLSHPRWTECFLTIHLSLPYLKAISEENSQFTLVWIRPSTFIDLSHQHLSGGTVVFFHHILVAQQQLEERSQGALQLKKSWLAPASSGVVVGSGEFTLSMCL